MTYVVDLAVKLYPARAAYVDNAQLAPFEEVRGCKLLERAERQSLFNGHCAARNYPVLM